MSSPEEEARTYTVQPGDDLLTVALQLDVSVDDLAASLGPREDLLHPRALLEVYPEWVTARNRVEQPLGGFRLFRKPPPEVSDDPQNLDVKPRIERLFNLLGYSLAETAAFDASTQGLPIPPAEPDAKAPNGLFALAAGDPQPWVYARLLPVAAWAKRGARGRLDVPDPYAGLGKEASIKVRFHDVFGISCRAPASRRGSRGSSAIGIRSYPSTRGRPSRSGTTSTTQKGMHAARMLTRIKFAPAGYVGTPGTRLERIRSHARTDRARFSLVYHQIAAARAKVTMTTTLKPGHEEVVDSEALSSFACRAYAYLGAIECLKAVCHEVGARDSLCGIAEAFRGHRRGAGAAGR